MPDLQLRYHVHSEQEPEVKEQQQDERREYDPFPDAGRERVVPAPCLLYTSDAADD